VIDSSLFSTLDWKLVANLPYSVASPLIVDLAQSTGGPERMVVTLQHEVARRLVAPPECAGYGVLTLLSQLHYEPRSLFKIPAGCFFPAPEVDSSCVTLLRRTRPLLNSRQAGTFSRIVKRGFSQRRKMMFKLLKCDWREDLLSRAFLNAGLTAAQRAETVSVEQFAELLNHLQLLPLQVRSGLSEELSAHQQWTQVHPDRPSIFSTRIRSIERLKDMPHTDRLMQLLLQMEGLIHEYRSHRHRENTGRRYSSVSHNISL
jgi:hypothetical protein